MMGEKGRKDRKNISVRCFSFVMNINPKGEGNLSKFGYSSNDHKQHCESLGDSYNLENDNELTR